MEQKLKEKLRPRKGRSNDTVSLRQFSSIEQARITLAAEHMGKTISEFMAGCVSEQVQGTIRISFKENSQPQ